MTLKELMDIQKIWENGEVEIWAKNGHCLGMFPDVEKCPYAEARVLQFTPEMVIIDATVTITWKDDRYYTVTSQFPNMKG